MIIRKAMLAGAVMALASTPAWALPAKAPENGGTSHAPATTPQGPPASTPNYGSNNGAKNRSESGNKHAGGAASHRNGSHQGASPNNQGHRGGNRSGHEGHGNANHNGQHNAGHNGKAHKCRPHHVAYVAAGKVVSVSLTESEEGNTFSGELTVEVKRGNHHARADKGKTVTYTVEGVHVRGPVSVEAVKAGYRARLIGKITFLPRRCEAGEFTPTTTIRRIVFHAPPKSVETETTETPEEPAEEEKSETPEEGAETTG